ncbi:MAG: methyltransferase domain-containing protein [Oscillibacter sp.]|nr:methyltransferase domain-containing protein [Oscillibacter sp.]
MERREEIRQAYGSVGAAHGFYDGMMSGSTRLGRWVQRHVWRMDPEDAMAYQTGALAAIPAGFSGRLLEVPVGTGVLSMPVFRTLPEAEIVCLDYSEKMMDAARRRAAALGVGNVTFCQGDVGQLPFPDESFDIVVSLNGFHAFPDKERAYRETWRVLRRGGRFCGCFYVEGGNAHTDRCIRRLYVPAGFFTPPFETEESLRTRLAAQYRQAEVGRVQGIAYFQCVK